MVVIIITSPLKIEFSYEKLESMTNGFSEENFIGKFQFGRVYRGIYERQHVTVKIYENPLIYDVYPGDNFRRFTDEVRLLKHFSPIPHPNLVQLLGYCCEDTFTWPERIKVALGLARLLQFFHAPEPPYLLPYLLRNLDAAHIMLDQVDNPILFDYSMISGGILTDRRDLLNQHVDGCYGYQDPTQEGRWSEKSDLFAYGVVLLGLITKRVYTEEDRVARAPFIYQWAQTQYKPQKSKSSLVYQSLGGEPLFYHPSDGFEITNLAMQCVEYNPKKRPSMKQVVRRLLKLHVIRYHAEILDIDRMLPNVDKLSGFSKLMAKIADADVQLTCGDMNGILSIFQCQGGFFRQICGSLNKWCLPCFPQSIHCECVLSESQRCPAFIQAGTKCSGKHYQMIEAFSYNDLNLCTNGFSEQNLIGKFQFGKVYRGKFKAQEVTVKIWECPKEYIVQPGDNESRLRDEIDLLQHPNFISHSNVVKLIGHCHEEEHLGIVYDLKPLDSVRNLILEDSFTWIQRIKVGLRFACLLKSLHADNTSYLPYLVRNIDAAHIMLDEDYNPLLFDFGMICGGILTGREIENPQFLAWCYGYVDPDYALRGYWSDKCDVFSFGIVLLSLIAKKVYTEEDRLSSAPFMEEWAQSEYEAKVSESGSHRPKCSLVHESLEVQQGFCSIDAHAITKLALQCVKFYPYERPTMKQVVKSLLNLHVVQCNPNILSLSQ